MTVERLYLTPTNPTKQVFYTLNFIFFFFCKWVAYVPHASSGGNLFLASALCVCMLSQFLRGLLWVLWEVGWFFSLNCLQWVCARLYPVMGWHYPVCPPYCALIFLGGSPEASYNTVWISGKWMDRWMDSHWNSQAYFIPVFYSWPTLNYHLLHIF